MKNATKQSTGDKGSETPAQPTTPTKPNEGNKDHGTTPAEPSKLSKSEANGSQTTKPTIVLPDSGSSTNTQGQYVNVVSQPSVASQAGIQAPASMETTNV